ncbi:type VI secretion system-associated FHA domain protein TagH [Rhodobacteraceae bacterium 2376]|uniref:Type VI secretion system-associated FHA domain protein TagH n=1 Tax=Rhabdonatronobacter sediminivivens TaxID=2743469 RepID=A0A7Z0KZM2_9RHOB|nr:type VI secretion system-associated FHA domain protein TagH [Rhabdonatronobacter sediminivivens]NYS25641.1 type VI secretion system-associated FHA domain protein TagH [Rhabdonatronobacter sediminivivens]
MSVTLRFQSTGTVPGSGEPVKMRAQSLTIGRGPDNDLVLPDPDRLISKTHCVVEDHGGNIVVLDLSTNGTFLNYGKVPLGPTPTPLNDGDVLSLGTYELAVVFDPPAAGKGAGLADPLEQRPVSHGDAQAGSNSGSPLDDLGSDDDFLDDLLDGGSQPKGPDKWVEAKDTLDDFLPPLEEDDLLGPAPLSDQPAVSDHSPATSDAFTPRAPNAPQIPDDWDDLLEPDAAPPPPGSPPPAAEDDPLPPEPAAPPDDAPAPPPEPRPQRPAPQAAAPAQAAMPPGATGGDAAARAFLNALGAEDVTLADDELEATMERLGATMRMMIRGLREVLMTRTSIKNEFRIEQTRISVGDNNPLKFSVSPDQAIEVMVRPRAKGYLSAQAATEQALDDIKAHEVAMVTGMEAALRGILRRLDPAALAGRIESGGGITRLLKGKKALYWETYEKMYAEISDQATHDFHDIFSREFAEAYRKQLDKLKQER